MAARCPICHYPNGFHDIDDAQGEHHAARARILPTLKWPSNTQVRRQRETGGAGDHRTR